MIKRDKGTVTINGSTLTVLAEFSVLVRSLHHDVFINDFGMTPEESEAKILDAVKSGFRTKEEAQEHAKECIKEIFDGLGEMLKEILQGKDDK